MTNTKHFRNLTRTQLNALSCALSQFCQNTEESIDTNGAETGEAEQLAAAEGLRDEIDAVFAALAG